MGFTPMAMANPPKPIGTCKILREALTLSTKNVRLILPILLISILSTFLLVLGRYLAFRPLLVDLFLKSTSLSNYKPGSPEFSNLLAAIQKDGKELAAEGVIFFIVAFFIQSLLQITMIHAITTTYSGELLTQKELFLKVKRGLKGPMITQVYAALLNLGYLLILLTLVVVSVFMSQLSIALVILGLFVVLLALVFFPYLATVLSLSAVISVAEEGCYGVGAIGRAVELIKGKKKQAISIILLCSVLEYAIGKARIMAVASCPLSTAAQAAAGFVYAALLTALTLFTLSTITVLYDECKRDHGEVTIGMAGDYAYTILSTADAPVNKELP
ncbi:uncharacterized protein LOC103701684 [Phoenix dactylifera]|uniref:Uncharacterized protein LOC103701684 n=1 Tax=Phoenix dactylifera TaxID=42345 RepID=A0A8B7BNM5_PHODC|nr:uncharacterized protein LOC103701684 [Phoenix dactylifera]